MTRSRFFKKTYHSNYRGKVSVEDAVKHQTYLDDMRKDAVFYCVDHIESSMIPHSMLHKIIQKLKTKQNDSLTLPEKAYLVRQNLNALHSLVEGKISFNQYKKEKSFGNGRFVRSVLEKSMMKQARRLCDKYGDDLSSITDEEIVTLIKDDFSLFGLKKPSDKKIGF